MASIAIALLLVGPWVYVGVSTLAAWRFARRRPALFGLPPIYQIVGKPAVSVLKPLHGAEPGLAENLRSFADQDYPVYQLVLGVHDGEDSAVPIARAMRRERPGTDIQLIVDRQVRGSNLKVANLENILPVARHEVIVIADSDMRVTPDYLAAVTAPLAHRGVGLVTCLYKGAADRGPWSNLAALYINFGFLPGALVGDAIDVGGGCFGATIALRREVLDRVGGFAPLRDELADDHRMGSAIRRLGLSTMLSPYIVENRVSEPSFTSLWRHELRWARTSRAMAPVGYAGSLVTHSLALALIAAMLTGSAVAWGGVMVSLLLRWASAAAMARWLALPTAGLSLLPLRDLLSFAVFLASFCGRSVSWRDQSFRLEPGGRMRIEGDKAA